MIRERRDPIVLPSEDDIDSVVAICPGNFARLVRLAQYTGMRQEEIGGLERGQVRLDARAIDLSATKSDRPRSVPLDERAAGTIAGTPAHLHSRWVFWHHDGTRYSRIANQFSATVRRAIKRGLIDRPFRFHDLRHWYAVDYLRDGGNIYDLKQILGHSSIQTTEDYLAHLTPDEARRAKYGSAQKPAQTERS